MSKKGFQAVGSVRGKCPHVHRTAAGAHKCVAKDNRDCRSLGGGCYSDRVVVHTSGRELTDSEELELSDCESAHE